MWSICFPLTAGCSTCLGDARKSPQCRYLNVREEPMKGDLKTLSPAFIVCGPSKRKRHDPGPVDRDVSGCKFQSRPEIVFTVIGFNESNADAICVWND